LLASKGIIARKVKKNVLKIEDRVMAGKFLIDSGKVKIKPELPL
jgi:hypothetical protein